MGGHGPLDLPEVTPVPWLNKDILAMDVISGTARVALAATLLRQHWANWRAKTWAPIRDQVAALGRTVTGIYHSLSGGGNAELEVELRKAADRLEVSRVSVFRGTLPTSMLEQLGHTTVGAALYTCLLPLFDLPCGMAMATRWALACAANDGVTRQELVVLHCATPGTPPLTVEMPRVGPLVWMVERVASADGGYTHPDPRIQSWARRTAMVLEAYAIKGTGWTLDATPRAAPTVDQIKGRRALGLPDANDLFMPACVLLDVALWLPPDILHNLEALVVIARMAL